MTSRFVSLWFVVAVACSGGVGWGSHAFAGHYGAAELELDGMIASLPCEFGETEDGSDAQMFEQCMEEKTAILQRIEPYLRAMYTHYAEGEHPYGLFLPHLSNEKAPSSKRIPVRFQVVDPNTPHMDSTIRLSLYSNQNLSRSEQQKMAFDFLLSQRYAKAGPIRAQATLYRQQFGTREPAGLRNLLEQGHDLSNSHWIHLYPPSSWTTALPQIAEREPTTSLGVFARILSAKPISASHVKRLGTALQGLNPKARVALARLLLLYLPQEQWISGSQRLRAQVPELADWLDGFTTPPPPEATPTCGLAGAVLYREDYTPLSAFQHQSQALSLVVFSSGGWMDNGVLEMMRGEGLDNPSGCLDRKRLDNLYRIIAKAQDTLPSLQLTCAAVNTSELTLALPQVEKRGRMQWPCGQPLHPTLFTVRTWVHKSAYATRVSPNRPFTPDR